MCVHVGGFVHVCVHLVRCVHVCVCACGVCEPVLCMLLFVYLSRYVRVSV